MFWAYTLVKNIHGELCSKRNRQLPLRDFTPNVRNVDTSLVLLGFSWITVSFKFGFYQSARLSNLVLHNGISSPLGFQELLFLALISCP